MELYNVVTKLIGPVDPAGETNTDNERFENLKVMTDLVNRLLTDIDTVAYNNKDKKEFSKKRAADYAINFYKQIGIV